MKGMYIKNYKHGIVYDGENRRYVIDIEASNNFYSNVERRKEYDLKLYWQNVKIKFSDFSWEASRDVSEEKYEEVLELSRLGYMDDYTLWVWREIIIEYRIEENADGKLRFKERDLQVEDAGVEEWAIIMMKEEIMGYKNKSLITRMQAKQDPIEIEIGQDYEIEWSEYKIEGNYTAALRYVVLHKIMEEWNADKRHKTRRGSMLQRWQADMLKRMGRRTVALVPRRSGKSVLMSLEILKEMLWRNLKSWTRPRTVIFVSKDFDAVGQIMDYISTLMESFEWMKKMFKYSESTHILELRWYDDDGNKKTISQCKFYSALGKLPWVGDAADAVFIDEAMLVPTRIKDKLMAIVTHEWARFLAMSTFYGEDEDKVDKVYYWPVEMCNKFEKESSKITDINAHVYKRWQKYKMSGEELLEDEVAGLRYTIDEVDVIEDKETAKDELSGNWERYMRELYCRAGQKNTVFQYEASVMKVREQRHPYHTFILTDMQEDKEITTKFDRIIMAYDPAQSGDISALLAIGYDWAHKKISVIKEWQLNYLDKSSFIPQAGLIKKAEEELKLMYQCPIMKCIDSTHQAVVDVMWGQDVRFQYLYFWVGWSSIKKWSRPSEERIPKQMMVEALQTMFDNQLIEIWSDPCKNLVNQLGTFVEYKNEYLEKSKYSNESWGHDDYVAALMMATRTLWEHYGLKTGVFRHDVTTEQQKILEEEEDPYHLRTMPQEQNTGFEGIDYDFRY